jgi:hypothetical protein
LLCYLYLANQPGYARAYSFTKVCYDGGSISTDVQSNDWNNKLTIDSKAIQLALSDGQIVSIFPRTVTSLSYGREAISSIGPAIGLGFVSFHLDALLGRRHKAKLHFIGVSYVDEGGKGQAILLQVRSGDYSAMLLGLQKVTGMSVVVSEKERKEIPANISVEAVKEPPPLAPPFHMAYERSRELAIQN